MGITRASSARCSASAFHLRRSSAGKPPFVVVYEVSTLGTKPDAVFRRAALLLGLLLIEPRSSWRCRVNVRGIVTFARAPDDLLWPQRIEEVPAVRPCYGSTVSDSALSERARWAMVATRLREEARGASPEAKLTQLASLMASVDDFGWREALSDDAHVWQLWNRLRESWQRDCVRTPMPAAKR